MKAYSNAQNFKEMDEDYKTEISEKIVQIFKVLIINTFYGFGFGFGFTFAAWCFVKIAGDFI